jgi:hypothetical protein
MIVLTYAAEVHVYNTWMLRKYTAVEAQQKSKEQAAKEQIGDSDIPFGSRAIESGIEVEGIWISK